MHFLHCCLTTWKLFVPVFARICVEFELLLSTNSGILRQSEDGLIGHSTLPIGMNVSCMFLHVSPVMNDSFLGVYSAFT